MGLLSGAPQSMPILVGIVNSKSKRCKFSPGRENSTMSSLARRPSSLALHHHRRHCQPGEPGTKRRKMTLPGQPNKVHNEVDGVHTHNRRGLQLCLEWAGRRLSGGIWRDLPKKSRTWSSSATSALERNTEAVVATSLLAHRGKAKEKGIGQS